MLWLALPVLAAAPDDGTLGVYVARALDDSPEVHAAHAVWREQLARTGPAGAPPDPRLSFGAFLRSVETRTGPQQARVSLSQSLPWPTRLGADRGAARAEADAAGARLDAVSLGVSAEVRRRYWTLWEVRAVREVHRAHLQVLHDLATTLRARVEVGSASLADLQQLDLGRARLADEISTMEARERGAAAALRELTGGQREMPTEDAAPEPEVPAEALEALVRRALEHPVLTASVAQVDAAEATVRGARAQRLPDLSVSADWIAVGVSDPTVPDAGKDAWSVGVGVSLPLWQGADGQRVEAARAGVDRRRAEVRALERGAAAAVEATAARVVDSARRVELVRDTLVPQAEGTYTSLLGAYAVGGAGVAQVLLAQRDLLELRADELAARATLARAWADLEHLCGADLPRVSP